MAEVFYKILLYFFGAGFVVMLLTLIPAIIFTYFTFRFAGKFTDKAIQSQNIHMQQVFRPDLNPKKVDEEDPRFYKNRFLK